MSGKEVSISRCHLLRMIRTHPKPWTLRYAAMDKETFDRMWAMSGPGSPAEHCFLRLRQEELYPEGKKGPSFLENMPEVCNVSPKSINPPFVHN